ncbi:hypothetical protein ACLB2K_037770 [Fragaria x ananassa]
MASSSSTLVLSTLFSSLPHQTQNPNTKHLFSLFPTSQKLPKMSLTCSPFLRPNTASNQIQLLRRFRAYTTIRDADKEEEQAVVGEDSAEFLLSKQKLSSWLYFTAILGTVLFVLNVAWIDNSTGFGKPFIEAVSELSDSPEKNRAERETSLVEAWNKSCCRAHRQPPKRENIKWWLSELPLRDQRYYQENLCTSAPLLGEEMSNSMRCSYLAEVVMLLLILIFAIVHSGLASLRDTGEKLIGERAFRVLFAGTSLPLAVSTVVYFINHRYDGVQLWQLKDVFGVHELVWLSNFVSFFFLYPSTFNLLEVAAVDKPKMHLWETGIMRITRHPQLVGQVVWCLAHTIWIGNSVTVAASVGLIGHHLFGAWNGDRRLAIRYGENFEVVKKRTSILPFAAIIDGRQKLPKDYYKEFIRLPYFVITALTLGAYFAHPLMQAASFGLHW